MMTSRDFMDLYSVLESWGNSDEVCKDMIMDLMRLQTEREEQGNER